MPSKFIEIAHVLSLLNLPNQLEESKPLNQLLNKTRTQKILNDLGSDKRISLPPLNDAHRRAQGFIAGCFLRRIGLVGA